MKAREQQLKERIAQLEKELAEKTIEVKYKKRDLEIEASLERIREKTMVMRHSNELREVVAVIYEQLQCVGFKYGACTIIIIDEKSGRTQHWVGGFTQTVYPESYNVNYFDHPFYKEQLERWKNGEKYVVIELSGEMKRLYDDIMFTRTDFKNFPEEAKKWMTQLDSVIFSIAYMKHGALTWGPGALSQEHSIILQRFARVFEQTYTRFLDLKKAEAQAKEAQIEVALERIRAKALAMQISNDLLDVANALREQMGSLGQPELESSIVHIYNDDSETFEAWYAFSPPNLSSGEIITGVAIVPKDSSLWAREVMAKYKSSDTEYTIVASGQKLLEWYKVLEERAPVTVEYDDNGQMIIPEILYYHFSNFSGGSLLMISNKEPSREARELQRRAALVFDLAYTRFLDLQKAEAQAREAIKASSLDRIRAEIASMRTADDLQRITPSVWKELTVLGVPFLRCGVFIFNEKEEKVHIYLSTPEGKPLAALHLDFDNSDTTRNAAEYWRLQKVYTTHWDREQFMAWVQSLIGQGQIQTANIYQAGDKSPESLTLQFVPFTQGMLYVGSAGALTNTQIELVKALAEAFSIAYARYEDFKKLEAAKNTVETTLNELKSTQSQLIQSEKMASLGELTAGIAHEIQNPLNFVNNFSEVNRELVDEMEEALKKDDKEEAITIASDIKENLEKINHHGKRADAIVKGMLQHSRSSTGKKEPTDINALADEYLRLSFHGLKAKDKSFNAAIRTDFDESIGNVNVVPQDIGRVLLNLFNNAFYAVTEKNASLRTSGQTSSAGQHYEPTVSVATKAVKPPPKAVVWGLQIVVKDNGMGISKSLVDKIFQPFFTTKPTGQGTGLGLSLSYDIIKAHGGEIKVETKEGEYAEFIIQLPD